MNNKVIISAAGSGKTTYLVKKSLSIKDGRILITTFTEANKNEIKKKFIELNSCIPENVVIQTWFSFLLQHGVRPFQGGLTDRKIKGMILVNSRSGLKYIAKFPVYYGEEKDFDKYYFNDEGKMYSDKIAKFVHRCNEKSKGAVTERIENIFKYIFIDEVQDLAGWDLELVKLFMTGKSELLMVGDPRQVTYHTHDESKYKKYADGNIEGFLLKECSKILCNIDKETLNSSFRNNRNICCFSSKLYPEYEECKSKQEKVTEHDGIFLVRSVDVCEYIAKYKPVQLRNSSKSEVISYEYPIYNYGISKGLTFDRVLIYPTKPIINWLKNHSSELASASKSKFYVALTRAKYSVAIVMDYTDKTNIEDTKKYTL